jgi:hypothetical protein
MIDLAISSRLDNESEPVVTRPNMGTLLKLERAFKLESAPEALRTPKLEHGKSFLIRSSTWTLITRTKPL